MYVGTPTVSLLVGVRQSGQMQDDMHPAQICNWTAGATAARASLLWPLPMCMGGVAQAANVMQERPGIEHVAAAECQGVCVDSVCVGVCACAVFVCALCVVV